MRMIELKEEVNRLRVQTGMEPKYQVDVTEDVQGGTP